MFEETPIELLIIGTLWLLVMIVSGGWIGIVAMMIRCKFTDNISNKEYWAWVLLGVAIQMGFIFFGL